MFSPPPLLFTLPVWNLERGMQVTVSKYWQVLKLSIFIVFCISHADFFLGMVTHRHQMFLSALYTQAVLEHQSQVWILSGSYVRIYCNTNSCNLKSLPIDCNILLIYQLTFTHSTVSDYSWKYVHILTWNLNHAMQMFNKLLRVEVRLRV